MMNLIYVFIGGGIGSILRYLIQILMQKQGAQEFPLGTFVVNILGCLIIGILAALFSTEGKYQESIRLLLVIGVCGGFTTFSTFSIENLYLFQSGAKIMAIYNILITNIGCLAATYAGWWLCKQFTTLTIAK